MSFGQLFKIYVLIPLLVPQLCAKLALAQGEYRDPMMPVLPEIEEEEVEELPYLVGLPAPEEAEEEIQRAPEELSIKVQGMFWDIPTPQAIVNNKFVKIGDSVEGAMIVKIDKQGVHFFYNKEEFIERPRVYSTMGEEMEVKIPVEASEPEIGGTPMVGPPGEVDDKQKKAEELRAQAEELYKAGKTEEAQKLDEEAQKLEEELLEGLSPEEKEIAKRIGELYEAGKIEEAKRLEEELRAGMGGG